MASEASASDKQVILVTGASGFIGQHVIKHLQENDRNVREIRCLDLRPYVNNLGACVLCPPFPTTVLIIFHAVFANPFVCLSLPMLPLLFSSLSCCLLLSLCPPLLLPFLHSCRCRTCKQLRHESH